MAPVIWAGAWRKRQASCSCKSGRFHRDETSNDRAQDALERVIGAKIFERSRAGVTTTIAGNAFIRGARPMVANADKLVAMMRATGQGRAGRLPIGHHSSVSAGNLRATMLGWHNAHPNVDLDGVEASRPDLLVGRDTGAIDIAVLIGDVCHDGFRREPFWSERILAALPTNHRLAERAVVHWTDLRAERILLTASDLGIDIRDMLLGRLAMLGMTPDIRMRHSSRETILSVLGGGLGVSIICDSSTGASYSDVVYRRPSRRSDCYKRALEETICSKSYCACWRALLLPSTMQRVICLHVAAGPRFLNCYPRYVFKLLNINRFDAYRGQQKPSSAPSEQGKLARIFALAAA